MDMTAACHPKDPAVKRVESLDTKALPTCTEDATVGPSAAEREIGGWGTSNEEPMTPSLEKAVAQFDRDGVLHIPEVSWSTISRHF